MENNRNDIWVLIPAYNESGALPHVISRVKSMKFNVLVVDDGSRDKTYDVSLASGAVVLRNDSNIGKGASLKKGIEYLLSHYEFGALITMDGDGLHKPEEICFFVDKMQEGAEFIVGNRMNNPRGMPKIRILTNRAMSSFLSLLCGQSIPDTQCGFRLISRRVLQDIFIESENFEVESELLLKAARNRIAINSVDVSSIYSLGRCSHIHPFVDTLRFVKFMARWFLKRKKKSLVSAKPLE